MDITLPSASTVMENLHHPMPIPEGWQAAWVDRRLPALNYYMAAIFVLFAGALVLVQLRDFLYCCHVWKERPELPIHPNERKTIFKKINKHLLWTSRANFKIALVYMANALIITLVDCCIGIFVLAEDVSQHPEVWDKDMIVSIGLYCAYLLVLFVGSLILLPLLQMLAVTWALTRASRNDLLSDHIRRARTHSTMLAGLWCIVSLLVVCYWPLVDSVNDASYRFVVLEAVWGSALAWLAVAFLFNYPGHGIGKLLKYPGDGVGDKKLNGNTGVGEIISLYAKAAGTPFREQEKDVLPRYDSVVREQPVNDEKR